MNGRFTLKDSGRVPSLAGVRAYLEKTGWKVERMPERALYRCQGLLADDGEPLIEYLPAGEEYSDYYLRLEDLIAVLAAIKDRPAVEIVEAMNAEAGKKRSTRAS